MPGLHSSRTSRVGKGKLLNSSPRKIKTALKWLASNDKRRSLFRRPLGFSCADGGFSRDHPKRQIEKGELQRAPIGIPVRIRSGSFGSD